MGYINPREAIELDASRKVVHEFGTMGPPLMPSGYPVIDRVGRLFLDQDPGRKADPPILVYTPDTPFLTAVGANGSGDGQLVWPTGMAIDANGDLVVADVGDVLNGHGHGRLQKFRLGGELAP